MDVKINIMKNLTIIFMLLISVSSLVSCESSDDSDEARTEWECGTHNGNTLYTGPQGGCYYYNSNGNKTYVDRSECDC